MFVREKIKPNGSVEIWIAKSVRQGNKVKQVRVRSLGCHKDKNQIEIVKKAAYELILQMKNTDWIWGSSERRCGMSEE